MSRERDMASEGPGLPDGLNVDVLFLPARTSAYRLPTKTRGALPT